MNHDDRSGLDRAASAAHTISSNTNSFIGQYCAAREQDWATISLENLKQLLRGGKSHLYSFTRTSEMRTVEADDPDTEDVVETKQETWYIYTLVYNGEAYFADQVFHLTDDQKKLADNYAQNLNLFLGDGMNQYAEYDGFTVSSMGDVRFTDGATEVGCHHVPGAFHHRRPFYCAPGREGRKNPGGRPGQHQAWDLSIILNEASKRPGAGGPFWIIGL